MDEVLVDKLRKGPFSFGVAVCGLDVAHVVVDLVAILTTYTSSTELQSREVSGGFFIH